MNNIEKVIEILNEPSMIFEMANINQKDHKLGIDIKMNILQPGNLMIKHGPRVKCFRSKTNTTFSISLSDDISKIKIMDGDPLDLVSKKEKEKILSYIKKYRIPLLNLWNDPYNDIHDFLDQVSLIDSGQEVELTPPQKGLQ